MFGLEKDLNGICIYIIDNEGGRDRDMWRERERAQGAVNDYLGHDDKALEFPVLGLGPQEDLDLVVGLQLSLKLEIYKR